MAVEGAIKSLCNRLVVVDLSSRTSKDLGEQCVKVSSSLKRYSLFICYPYCLITVINYCNFLVYKSAFGVSRIAPKKSNLTYKLYCCCNQATIECDSQHVVGFVTRHLAL